MITSTQRLKKARWQLWWQARACGGLASPPVLIVPDSLAGAAELGRLGAPEVGRPVVGVTGSAGKTTAKDAIAHLLAVGIAGR